MKRNDSAHPVAPSAKAPKGIRLRRTPSAVSSSGTAYGVNASTCDSPRATSAFAPASAPSALANSTTV